MPIKKDKGQKGPAQKKIKKEANNKVSLFNCYYLLFNAN
jgi:hypothetical protein